MRWLNLLIVLIVNAVPLIGVKFYGWSASTVVVLYWFENLAIAVFTCARLVIHRRLTRKRGYWRGGTLGLRSNGKLVTSGLLGEYATLAFVFTLAHGVFVGAFVLIGAQNHTDDPHWAFSREQLLHGAQWILIALGAEFLIDLLTLRQRSFAWIKAYVGARTGRVLIMHLAIIFGMWAMMATESPFAVLYVLIALKTLWDLAASSAPATADALPGEPPRWALRIADGVSAKEGGGAKLRTAWEQRREDMIRAAKEDEEVMPA